MMTYAEPFKPAWFDSLSTEQQQRYRSLKDEYDLFGMMIQSFGPYSRMLNPDQPRPTLPLEARLAEPVEVLKTIPEPILKETAYREFLELCTAHGEAGLAKFRAVRATAVHGE
jgi:restriction system protein